MEGALALKRIWEDATIPKRVYYRSTKRPKTTTEPYWYWEQPVKRLTGRQNPFILVEGTDRICEYVLTITLIILAMVALKIKLPQGIKAIF